MPSPPARRSLPVALADELHAAFGQHASATRWRWKVSIRALPPQDSDVAKEMPAVVRIDLSSDDSRALAALLGRASGSGEGPGSGGPSATWIGSGDAAKRIGVAAGTIRGWIARNGPKTHPFPQPERCYRRRNYWKTKTIDKWDAEQRSLEQEHRASRPRAR